MAGKIIATEAKHQGAIDMLLAQSFGPGRRTRMAERLREQSAPYKDLAFVYIDDAQVLASISYSPIRVREQAGLLLGPLIVSAALQNQGIGIRLMEHTLALADGLVQFQFVLLVGDLHYYQRVGFVQAENITAPAPVDYGRLLVRGKTDIAGKIYGAPDLA